MTKLNRIFWLLVQFIALISGPFIFFYFVDVFNGHVGQTALASAVVSGLLIGGWFNELEGREPYRFLGI